MCFMGRVVHGLRTPALWNDWVAGKELKLSYHNGYT